MRNAKRTKITAVRGQDAQRAAAPTTCAGLGSVRPRGNVDLASGKRIDIAAMMSLTCL